LQKGQYVFVVEKHNDKRIEVHQGHIVVFNANLSDSLPKVIYYKYNYDKVKILTAEDLIDASTHNDFIQETPEGYKREQ
jgi:hypothetical protein